MAESDQAMLTAASVESMIRKDNGLAPIEHVNVADISAGCGTSFSILVVTDAFTGVRLVDRHRMVHSALGDVMPTIHALQLRCLTPQAHARICTQTA